MTDEVDEMSAASRGSAANGWTPVAERLPEDGDTVWVYEGGDYVFLADYSSGRFLSVGHELDREGLNYEQYTGITHWMEVAMPPPPSDGK